MAVAARDLVPPDLRAGDREGGKPPVPAELAERAAPVSLAADQRLPVLPALEPLLPARGLRRGSVVAVEGSSSLALALAAAASAGGSWCAAVGRPPLGLLAAAEVGMVLDRFPRVPVPDPSAGARPGGWAWVVATLLDALDVVIAWPAMSGRAVRPGDARRLAARARERGSVLVVAEARGWPEAPDVRLAVTRSEWIGPGAGDGRLRGRRVEVVAGGRGAAARERRATLWLPAPGGGVTAASEDGASGGADEATAAGSLREVG
jgi:hypothetical protein